MFGITSFDTKSNKICECIAYGQDFSQVATKFTAERCIEKTVAIKGGHKNIDIAIMEIEDGDISILNAGLQKGNTDTLKQIDHIAIAGFPNYNPGDSGYFTMGQITGFRTISSIRHIQVSNILVEGNSGGPAIDINGEVIGIAATGAESFKNGSSTEKHGIIPINAIELMIKTSEITNPIKTHPSTQ